MIKPIGKRVLIKPSPKEDTTKSGIILPSDSINPSFLIGEVLISGSEIKTVKKGDIVAHKKYGMEVMPTDDGDRYLVDETSIIAVYE